MSDMASDQTESEKGFGRWKVLIIVALSIVALFAFFVWTGSQNRLSFQRAQLVEVAVINKNIMCSADMWYVDEQSQSFGEGERPWAFSMMAFDEAMNGLDAGGMTGLPISVYKRYHEEFGPEGWDKIRTELKDFCEALDSGEYADWDRVLAEYRENNPAGFDDPYSYD